MAGTGLYFGALRRWFCAWLWAAWLGLGPDIGGLSARRFVHGLSLGLLSSHMAESPFVGLFAWVGPHGVTLFLLLISICALNDCLHVRRVSVRLLTCARSPRMRDVAETTVRLVQPNAPQEAMGPVLRSIFLIA